MATVTRNASVTEIPTTKEESLTPEIDQKRQISKSYNEYTPEVLVYLIATAENKVITVGH